MQFQNFHLTIIDGVSKNYEAVIITDFQILWNMTV